MPKPASSTPEDAALLRAVAEALLHYQRRGAVDRKMISNKELASTLGVSPAMISNLFALLDTAENGSKRQKDISGQLLLRVLKAGIPINYGELQFIARSQEPQQIEFIFENSVPCENTAEGVAVRVERKGPAGELKVKIKVA